MLRFRVCLDFVPRKLMSENQNSPQLCCVAAKKTYDGAKKQTFAVMQ